MKWTDEYSGLDVHGVSLSNYDLTKHNGTLRLELADPTPTETLATSYLTKIDLKKNKPIDVKREFCLELKAISLNYSEPERNYDYLEYASKKVNVLQVSSRQTKSLFVSDMSHKSKL